MTENNGIEGLEVIARRCVAVCEEKKAADIVLFDVRENSILADYYLVCCGTSMPHVRALAEGLRRTLVSEGFKSRGQEGAPASQWIVLDFGVILIHVMTPELRRRYCLEELWDKRLIVFQGGEPLPEAPAAPRDDNEAWTEEPMEDDEDAAWDEEDFDEDEYGYEGDEGFEGEDHEWHARKEFGADDEQDDEFGEEDGDYGQEGFDEDEDYAADWDDGKKDDEPRDGGISLKDLFGEE